MTTLFRELVIYYSQETVRRICEKYGFEPMDALTSFVDSETYEMLTDPELEMIEFSPLAIFDMWEVEQLTGNPRNSLYLRRDEVV